MRVLANQRRVKTCWSANTATRASTTHALVRYLKKGLRFGTAMTADLLGECNLTETSRKSEQTFLMWSRRLQQGHFLRIGLCLGMKMRTLWTGWRLLILLLHLVLKLLPCQLQ